MLPARLFVTGGLEIASKEGTTQGDPVAMPLYAIGILPLIKTAIQKLADKNMQVKMVAYAVDITGAGKLCNLKVWWNTISYYGPFLGYHLNAGKSWLIVKPEKAVEADRIFADSMINVTCEGRKHLGAVIGSELFKNSFVDNLVDEWIDEIKLLSKISSTEPHTAYSAYINSVQHKFTYSMRTIPNISQNLIRLDKAVDDFVKHLLDFDFNDIQRKLLSQPAKFGGLGIKIPSEEADDQFRNSMFVTEPLKDLVVNQMIDGCVDDKNIRERKNQVKVKNLEKVSSKYSAIKEQLTTEKQRILECVTEKGASNWLTALPLKKYNFHLNKQEFRDAVYLRYGLPLSKLPCNCVCGARYSIDHALNCARGDS